MNRKQVTEHIAETYGVQAEYPWMSQPDYAVFRHENNRKWFAVIMDLPRQRMGLEGDGKIDIMNLKCDPLLIGSLRLEKGFFPAYHMSKANWISVSLDNSVETDKIKMLIDLSFDLTAKKIKKR